MLLIECLPGFLIRCRWPSGCALDGNHSAVMSTRNLFNWNSSGIFIKLPAMMLISPDGAMGDEEKGILMCKSARVRWEHEMSVIFIAPRR